MQLAIGFETFDTGAMPRRLPRARTLLDRIRAADLSTGAAAVAYNAFLGLVPLTAALVGATSVLGDRQAVIERVERALAPIAPGAVTDFVTALMADAGERLGGSGVLFVVVSGLIALFLGSRAVVALQRSLALIEGAVERRPAFQMRLVAVGLTVGGGVVLLLVSLLLVAGRIVFAFVGELIGWEGLTSLWVWLRIPVAALGLFGFLVAFYSLGPPHPVPRTRLAAAIATGGIVIGSLGFGAYLAGAPTLGATFGALGAVAIALVWLYLGALSILAAAIVAAAIDEGI